MRTVKLHVYSDLPCIVAEPTEAIPCCCDEKVQRYRSFDVTWNTIATEKGETVVTDCNGDGLTSNWSNT